MPVIRVLRGLSGSGKSTAALELVEKNGNWKRVNRDSLRSMILGSGKWSSAKEKSIVAARDSLIQSFIENGFNVVVDDTNLSLKTVNHLKNLAGSLGAQFEVDDTFLSVPYETCIKRDVSRAASVGRDVILNQWVGINPREKVKYADDLDAAVIFDIDGTLAYMKNRSPYEFNKVLTDGIHLHIREILLRYASDHAVFILSGRDCSCRSETEAWLEQSEIPYDFLHMRNTGDLRRDDLVKEEIYNNHIKGRFNVSLVVDDRPQVLRKWWQLGLPVISNNPLGLEF
jgi:predicted kinase